LFARSQIRKEMLEQGTLDWGGAGMLARITEVINNTKSHATGFTPFQAFRRMHNFAYDQRNQQRAGIPVVQPPPAMRYMDGFDVDDMYAKIRDRLSRQADMMVRKSLDARFVPYDVGQHVWVLSPQTGTTVQLWPAC
jgi:hypothetical protein